jgi:hypothetical protein
MILRFLVAMVVTFFLSVGPPSENVRGTGPPFMEDVEMADLKKEPLPTPSGVGGGAKTRAITVALKDLPNPAEFEDEYGLRFMDKYQEGKLTEVVESLKAERQMEPNQVFKRRDGKWELITGHRRTAAMYILALKNATGFSLDMAVMCLEILEASPHDLLVRAIADNELGKNLDTNERLRAVLKMHKADVPKKRGAAALGTSEKSYGRLVKIVAHPRVLDHVMKDHLGPTAASAIVEVAEKAGRLDEFLGYFDQLVERTKAEIEKADHLAKAETGKGLKPNAMLVMNNLEPHVVKGWIEALAKGKPLTEEDDLGFEANFNKKTAVATIKVKVDARNDSVTHVARIASQVSKVAQHLAAFAQKRHELEAPEGPQAALQKDESFLDLDLLKTFGLEEIAMDLEHELRGTDKRTPWAAPASVADDAKKGE